MRKILIYGDINLNYRDGSAIWLTSIAETLKRTNSDVYLLLKADVEEQDRVAYLLDHGIQLFTPFDDKQSGFSGMGPRQAAQRIAVLDRRHNFDVILSRGFGVASHLAVSGRFTNRLWPYLTEGPAFRFDQTDHEVHLLERIGDASRRVFVQTEEARSFLEAMMPTATGKTLLMSPIIPDEAFELANKKPMGHPDSSLLSLVYAGKFARLWNTLEMCHIPRRLGLHGINASLDMIGDKFQLTGNDHEWIEAMKQAAHGKSPRVRWRGGMQRHDVLEIVNSADIGVCWRHEELDSSLEISTKMLEYAAIGTPPLLNRSNMHERLLGPEYPLFIDGNDPLPTLQRAGEDRSLIRRARNVARKMASAFSMSRAASRLETYFQRAEGHTRNSTPTRRAKRVLLAGHDFKFASDLIESLTQRTDTEFRVDKWLRLAVHDEAASRELLQWADVIVCEWAGPNAVFYSQHLQPGQRLIIRFHGFEIRGDWLKDIDIDQVNAVVFVSDFYRKEVLYATGWPEHKTTVIYNAVDRLDLHRPKEADAIFRIGLAGYVPLLKRPDRAVDLLERLLHHDKRYHLHIRGRAPWNYPWEWDKPMQQDAYRALFARIANDRLLSNRVSFEEFGPDMGSWYRRVGWILSPSSRETFHLAPVEGMMSGAVPVVWERTGADEIFGQQFIQSDTDSAAEYILRNSSKEAHELLSRCAVEKASEYEIMVSRSQWIRLIFAENQLPLELNGTSILEGVSEPRNTAEATALFYREALAHGLIAGLAAIRKHRTLLSNALREKVDTWLEISDWLADPSRILAPRGLEPLYYPVPRTYLEIGRKAERRAGARPIPSSAPESSGNFRDDILIAADSFVRVARKERPQFIVASGSIGVCMAALIAARRLGIPFYQTKIDEPLQQDLTKEILLALRDLVVSNSEDLDTMNTQLSRATGERGLRKTLADVKIGLIADEFTRITISATLPTISLSRRHWGTQLDELDAVIVESAWEGIDGEWFHGVAYHGEEEAESLWKLLEACKSRGIATIFWNKEDPVHFMSFERASGWCDHVFTTDAGVISNYLASEHRTGQTVSSLSFFAQPTLHNPLPADWRVEDTVAFAGTYYGQRFKERSEELEGILRTAAKYGLKIYDRQYQRKGSPYEFPTEFQKYSAGSVPYPDMLKVYKSHPAHINVNSVANSPSMFSRRVVEIAASGSVVLSGYGRGVVETLGLDFPVLSSIDEWDDALRTLMTDEDYRLHVAWNQMRTVFRSHRADQALTLMLRTAGVAINPDRYPRYGLYINHPHDVAHAIRQTLPPTVITDDQRTRKQAHKAGLHTISKAEVVTAELDYVGVVANDIADTHCEDLLLVGFFAKADLLTPVFNASAARSLVSRGIGDLAKGLWSPQLAEPRKAQNPYRCHMPIANVY